MLPHPVQGFHLVGALVGFRAARHWEADCPGIQHPVLEGAPVVDRCVAYSPEPGSPVQVVRVFLPGSDQGLLLLRSPLLHGAVEFAACAQVGVYLFLQPPEPELLGGKHPQRTCGGMRLGRELGRKFCRGHARRPCCEFRRLFPPRLRRGFPCGALRKLMPECCRPPLCRKLQGAQEAACRK